jgi:hypothetical protein
MSTGWLVAILGGFAVLLLFFVNKAAAAQPAQVAGVPTGLNTGLATGLAGISALGGISSILSQSGGGSEDTYDTDSYSDSDDF